MKLLFDFFPMLLFIATFKLYGIYPATAIAIAASLIQVGFNWLKNKQLETMQLVTLALIVVLGGFTLVLHNELFIKWKPTAFSWFIALVFFSSQLFTQKTLLQNMMEETIRLPKTIWRRANLSCALFFALQGLANLYVIYHFDTNTWVNFKIFGILIMTLLFALFLAIYMAQHDMQNQQNPAENDAKSQ